MIITQHAVDRYILRVRPMSHVEARRQLKGLLAAAEREAEFSDGTEHLRVGDLRLVAFNGHVLTCYLAGG